MNCKTTQFRELPSPTAAPATLGKTGTLCFLTGTKLSAHVVFSGRALPALPGEIVRAQQRFADSFADSGGSPVNLSGIHPESPGYEALRGFDAALSYAAREEASLRSGTTQSKSALVGWWIRQVDASCLRRGSDYAGVRTERSLHPPK